MNKFKRSVATIMLSVVAATSLAGCTVKAKNYQLECCGTITLYSNNKLAVSDCQYFHCTTATGRWSKFSGGYTFYTTDSSLTATGQLSGNVMTIEF